MSQKTALFKLGLLHTVLHIDQNQASPSLTGKYILSYLYPSTTPLRHTRNNTKHQILLTSAVDGGEPQQLQKWYATDTTVKVTAPVEELQFSFWEHLVPCAVNTGGPIPGVNVTEASIWPFHAEINNMWGFISWNVDRFTITTSIRVVLEVL